MSEKKDNIDASSNAGLYIYACYAAILLIVLITVLTSLFPIENSDIWWHLKTGEYMVAERSIPDTDLFSFTAVGKPWITHEWLAELIFYALYAVGGLNLLIVFKVLVYVIIALILLYHIKRYGYKNPLLFAIVAAAICAGSFRLFVRPHLFTYLFLTILSINIFDNGYFEKSRSTTLIIIPALFLIWANIHSGFTIGLGVYWVLAAVAFVAARIRTAKVHSSLSGSLKKYILPPALATLAALANPNGLNAFIYPVKLATDPVFKNAIAEMISPFEVFSLEKLFWLLLVIIIGFAVYCIIRNVKSRIAISIILLIGTISSLFAIRNFFEFALLTAVASTISFPALKGRRRLAVTSAVLVFIVCIGFFSIKHINNTRGIGLGVGGEFPYGPADFLEKIDYEGNIYAPLGWGGYLIWRGWPSLEVFIDGRLLVYGSDFLNEYHFIRQNEPGALERLESYGTDVVAVPIGQERWRIRDAVAGSGDWKLCYFDDKSVVFLKKNDHNEKWLETWEYNKIDPLTSGYIQRGVQRADTAAILVEARRAYDLSPGSVTTNAVLARAYFVNSDFIEAANYFKAAITIAPVMTDFFYQVATSYHRGNQPDSAAIWYEKAIEARPEMEQAYFEYGAMEAGMGRYEKAIEIWGRVLKFDPESPARNYIEQVKELMNTAKPDSG